MVKLYEHQQEAMEQTKGFPNIAVYHDMGLGKTFTGSEMMKRFNTRVNLIVCQKSKIDDWMNHFLKNYSFDFLIYDLTNKWELEMFMLNEDQSPFERVGIINYELAWRRPELLKLQNFTLMLDESSLIQNKTAKQTKFILKLKPSHVILLSGTPVGGKYENLWTQCHLIGWDISETLYQKQYVNWKLIEVGGVYHKIVNKEDPYKNIDRLKNKMRSFGAIFKKTEECFQLPEQTFTTVSIRPIPQLKTFNKHGLVEVDGVELIGDMQLTKMLYSRQLCGQYNHHKLESIKDLIQSTNERLIIFYNFNDELEKLKLICQAVERPISEVNGHCKDLSAYENEEDSVTLCQYQSASKGLNLQKCNKIIYFTLPLSSEDYEQSKKRIHRIGQTSHCMYYLMICKGTIEERILETLEQRKDYTDELFRQQFD